MRKTYIILILLLLALAFLNLFFGSVSIPFADMVRILFGMDSDNRVWQAIVLQSRVPQCVTALFCGASLAVSGLVMQTAFNNPLAGPSILGVTTGSSLGVAVVTLIGGGAVAGTLFGWTTAILGALVGAFAVLAVLLALSAVIRSNVMLLIAGMMIGYLASSFISLLNFFATAEGVHSYAIWGLGSFGGVQLSQMPFFVAVMSAGLVMSVLLVKPLNAMLLGTSYAESLGINIRRTRCLLLIVTGTLSAFVTAFCGPISFIGLAVPHIARLVTRTSSHNVLLPVTMLIGAIVALACNLVCILPGGSGVLPLNAVTPVFGAPVVIYIIVNQHKINYFK